MVNEGWRAAGAFLLVVGFVASGAWADGSVEPAESRGERAREANRAIDDAPPRPLRLLVDEYRHRPRPDSFSMGFSLDQDDQKLAYVYGADVTGHVNGFFVLSQLIADDYQMGVSREPIGANLIDRADAFMIVCPPSAAKGGPHPLTQQDADHLESFVAQGGILILVYNSVHRRDADGLDFEGMNRVAARFGLEILPTETHSILVPLRRDDPSLIGVRNIIYGNGCTIATHPQPGTRHTTLLESSNPDVPGAVAVRARHGKGAVLLIGDAGVFGNAHMARTDTSHPRAVRQLFHSLLPEGPLPRYRWTPGLRMRVTLNHEVGVSGAPHEMTLLELPLHPDARSMLTGVRDLDLQSAPRAVKDMTAEEAAKALPARRYAFARAQWGVEAELAFQQADDRAFAAEWRGPDGATLASRITPRGEVMDASVDRGGLTEWRWALTNAALLSPLDPAARIGDTWTAPTNAAVPNTQLRPTPMLREVEATYRLAAREPYRGRDCFVVTRHVVVPLDDLRPQEIVNPDFADTFDEQKVRLRHAGHAEETKAWIDAATMLPVRTELQTSTTYWWTDRNQEDRFVSDHDHRVMETRHETRRVIILSRLLTADFEVVEP